MNSRLVLITALVFTLTIPTISLGQVAKHLNKGDKAPFDGILITEEKAVELYKAEKKVIVLEDLRLTQKELSEAYLEQNKQLEKKLDKAKFESFWLKTGLGVVLGFLVYKGVTN